MNKILMNKVIINENTIVTKINANKICVSKNVNVVFNIDKYSFDNIIIDIEENSNVIINKKYNEKDINENIVINLNGINSSIKYNFSTIVTNNQKYTIVINHNNKNTNSYITNHGVVLNDSKLIFEVNSIVKKGNILCDINQDSKIITMGRNNSIIKPNLFIDEYNVNAKHSAIIGKFNEEEIFYLKTKGLSEKQALDLLINGFIEGPMRR